MSTFQSPLPAGRPVVRGSVLMRRGDTAEQLLYVEQGTVALGLLGPDGLEHRLGVVEGPGWLDVAGAVEGSRALMDGVAETDVVVVAVPVAQVQQWLAASPPPARDMLADLARQHRAQTDLALSREAKDAEARCAEWLLHHARPVVADSRPAESAPLAVRLEQRKRQIAAQLGIAPETLSRVLRHLREQGLIRGTGRVLEVLNPVGLRELAGV